MPHYVQNGSQEFARRGKNNKSRRRKSPVMSSSYATGYVMIWMKQVSISSDVKSTSTIWYILYTVIFFWILIYRVRTIRAFLGDGCCPWGHSQTFLYYPDIFPRVFEGLQHFLTKINVATSSKSSTMEANKNGYVLARDMLVMMMIMMMINMV